MLSSELVSGHLHPANTVKVDNIKPHVDLFVFPVRHGVFVLASGRPPNWGCYQPSVLRDLASPIFFHERGTGTA